MSEPGDVILGDIQFADSFEIKTRPAVVLFKEFGNIVIAAVTSNPNARGVPLTKKDGAAEDSVIKTNYIFTMPEAMIRKRLFSLPSKKRMEVFEDMVKKLSSLKE